MIHPTAIVDDRATIGENVQIGPFAIVGPNVQIGDGTIVESSALIKENVQIGKNNHIFSFAVIGVKSQDLKDDGTTAGVVIGDNNQIREFATIHRSTNAEFPTKIGSGNLIMSYVHLAHDCVIGDGVVLANSCNFAGHVEIGDGVVVGGQSAISQFVKVGSYAFIGGNSGITKDIPPYTKGIGFPYKIKALNQVGLERRGFSPEALKSIKEIFKDFYYSDFSFTQAKEIYNQKRETLTPEQLVFLDFALNPGKGLSR